MNHDELTALQHSLRQMLLHDGIAAVLTALKKALPEQTDKYNLVFHIEARLNTVNKDSIRGILSHEQLGLAYNRMTADVLDFISTLQVQDFDVTTAHKSSAPSKTGAVLYQIPHTMIIDGETDYRCIVRLAFDEAVIVESLDLTKDTVLKPVRVSEVMEVELKDPGDSPAFNIQPVNSAQQFLEEKVYTEWQFIIRPLRPGSFPLLLVVAVKEIIQNSERRREIVLEEIIQVVTEAIAVTEDTGHFQQAGYAFFYTTVPERTRMKFAWFAAFLAKINLTTKIAIVTAVVAAGVGLLSIRRGWFNADSKPKDLSTLEAQKDSSAWRQAYSIGKDSSFSNYLQKHPNGIFQVQAQAKLDSLNVEAQKDSSAWRQALSIGKNSSFSNYLQKHPNGIFQVQAQAKLDSLNVEEPSIVMPPDSRGSGFTMVAVKGGALTLGKHYENDPCAAKRINIRDYKIGKYEVTQADWKLIMDVNPAFKGSCDTCPVENVSWVDAQEFAQKASRTKGKKYRLPFEVEWEYAARGGSKSMGFKYAGSNLPDSVGWFNTIKEHSHEVGLKKPNELGIYDMSGNVREWCQGVYPLYLSCKSTVSDKKVLRGGSWVNPKIKLRVTYRSKENSNHKDEQSGFRLIEYD